MDEYISREPLVKRLEHDLTRWSESAALYKDDASGVVAMSEAFRELLMAPAVDVAPVRHGRWDRKIESYGPDACGEYWDEAFIVCSECGRREEADMDIAFSEKRFAEVCAKFPYCHCGAQMDLG